MKYSNNFYSNRPIFLHLALAVLTFSFYLFTASANADFYTVANINNLPSTNVQLSPNCSYRLKIGSASQYYYLPLNNFFTKSNAGVFYIDKFVSFLFPEEALLLLAKATNLTYPNAANLNTQNVMKTSKVMLSLSIQAPSSPTALVLAGSINGVNVQTYLSGKSDLFKSSISVESDCPSVKNVL